MIEHCCEMLRDAVDGDAVLNQPLLQMRGRIMNEVDSDYAVRSPEDRPSLYPDQFLPVLRAGAFPHGVECGKEKVGNAPILCLGRCVGSTR